MKRFLPIYIIMCVAALWSCADDDYAVSTADTLSFTADTLSLDTVFSTVPAPMKTFWVHNPGKHHIRMTNVRLERGNQTGFRVNVDGVFLGQAVGYQASDVEVRSGDSLRVFVELTSTPTNSSEPKLLEDNLVFSLSNGPEQKVNLRAYSWDATIYRNLEIKKNTTLAGPRPILIYGALTVAEEATLTLKAGTQLFFHDQASLEVRGTLLCQGEPGNEVVMRGARLDHMFDYLPYDRVSGQWQGLKFRESSFGNLLEYTDIHSAFNGVELDASDLERMTLQMKSCTVHNCQGYGIWNHGAYFEIDNCQVTNALNDCVCAEGGITMMDNCTLAQFYPFDSKRGVALRFSDQNGDVHVGCYNTIVTGYADDELMGEQTDEGRAFSYLFQNCLLRTPKVEDETAQYYPETLFEDPKDSIQGKHHFLLIDIENLAYDFRLDPASTAIDAADKETAMSYDRLGIVRDDRPDIGAYEYLKPEEEPKDEDNDTEN